MVLSKVLPSFQPYYILNQSRFAFQAMQDKLSLRSTSYAGQVGIQTILSYPYVFLSFRSSSY